MALVVWTRLTRLWRRNEMWQVNTRPLRCTDGADGIRVTFQAASFDSLVTWLVALQRRYGVAVESANFDGTRQAGLVSATLVLRRS